MIGARHGERPGVGGDGGVVADAVECHGDVLVVLDARSGAADDEAGRSLSRVDGVVAGNGGDRDAGTSLVDGQAVGGGGRVAGLVGGSGGDPGGAGGGLIG